MAKLFANSGDPDQMPHSAASDMGLRFLLITLLRVSRLQWVNGIQLIFILMFTYTAYTYSSYPFNTHIIVTESF